MKTVITFAVLFLLTAITCTAQHKREEPVLNRLRSDPAVNRDSNFFLMYLFGASNASGCTVSFASTTFSAERLEVQNGRVGRTPFTSGQLKRLSAELRMPGFKALNLDELCCQDKTYTPHDFKVLVIIKREGCVINNEMVYFGCIYSQRKSEFYKYFSTLFDILNNSKQ